MKKLGILFTSRNNYQMLDSWLKRVDIENFSVLNIDEDSTPDNKTLGREVCKRHNINYIDREERGMQNNITSTFKFFKDKGINWLIWFQHDCFPLTDKFFNILNNKISSGALDQFGVIGFNGHHGVTAEITGQLYDTARAPLEVGDYWYRSKYKWGGTRVDYDKPGFDKPFAVESVAWYAAMVNMEQYHKYILPTDDYHFFHAWDDIAFQFLYNNVYNICLPDIDILHDQGIKKDFGIPAASPKAGEQRDHFYSKWGHHEVWKERWGFEYAKRETFEPVKDQYKDTLLYDFYYHDPINGPLKSFDI